MNTVKSGLEFADASAKSASEIQGNLPKVIEELSNAKERLSAVGLDMSKLQNTVNDAKTQVSNKLHLKNMNTEEIKANATKFSNSIANAVKSGAKGLVNIVHNTSVTDENYSQKIKELSELKDTIPRDENAIANLNNDIKNYEKNKDIKAQINDEKGDFITRGARILNAEGLQINPNDVTNKIKSAETNVKNIASSVVDNAKQITSSGFDLGKSLAREFTKSKPTAQIAGGSIKQIHNLSRKITSRIMKSLKDFNNTDRIKMKTKKRKPHKYTKKHRRYRK